MTLLEKKHVFIEEKVSHVFLLYNDTGEGGGWGWVELPQYNRKYFDAAEILSSG
jgi:hypothetical protein